MFKRNLLLILCTFCFCLRAEASHHEPVILFNVLPIKEKEFFTFLPVMQANAVATRKEAGNISFYVFKQQTDDTTLYLFEQWKSQSALEQHLETPHLNAVSSRIKNALKDGKTESSFRLQKMDTESPPAVMRAMDDTFIILTLNMRPLKENTIKNKLRDIAIAARRHPENRRFDIFSYSDSPYRLLVFQQWKAGELDSDLLTMYAGDELIDELSNMLSKPVETHRLKLKEVSQRL